MCGSAATAVLPSEELSVGTSRQPSSVWPSAETILAKAVLTPLRSRRFWRQEQHTPRHSHLTGGSLKPSFAVAFDEKFMRLLDEDARAVARVLFVADRAAVIQVDQNLQSVVTSWWDFLPLILTTKPMPHESCSNCGS